MSDISEKTTQTNTVPEPTAFQTIKDFGYNRWSKKSERSAALENIAKNIDPKDYNLIKDIRRVKWTDKDKYNRNLATQMLMSYHTLGDFSRTQPYKQKVEELERLTINKTEFGYNPNDSVDKRAGALIDLENKPRSVIKNYLSQIAKIGILENDPYVKDIALQIATNYNSSNIQL